MLYIATAQEKFFSEAEREVRAADTAANGFSRLPDGLFLFSSALPPGGLGARFAEARPVFLRHLHPAEIERPLPAGDDAPARIAEGCAPLLAGLRPRERIAVQVRQTPGDRSFSDFAVKEALDPRIAAAGGFPEVKKPERILSVYIARPRGTGGAKRPGAYYAGVSAPSENLNAWSGGKVRFAVEPGRVSRAENKLLEAMALGMLPLSGVRRALDIGSAPGGWTRVLHAKGCAVVSVDPAPISPAVARLPGVTYVKADAARFKPKGTFDLITDDMNWEAYRSARALKNCARGLPAAGVSAAGVPLRVKLESGLRAGGLFLMTVKLGKHAPAELLEKIERLLAPELKVSGARQLYHNRDEVTLWGVRA